MQAEVHLECMKRNKLVESFVYVKGVKETCVADVLICILSPDEDHALLPATIAADPGREKSSTARYPHTATGCWLKASLAHVMRNFGATVNP